MVQGNALRENLDTWGDMKTAASYEGVTLRRSPVGGQSRHVTLIPGMLVNAEIHLGTRSVLEYLLSPVQKVAHEAGRER